MFRLAEIDELAEAPEPGIRGTLQPGDMVGLYAVHPPSLDGWGEGMEPFEAVVVDVAAPGAYLGELPDGSPIEFTEANVAWVGASMGGIFDWMKQAFRGAVPPPPARLPGLPAPTEPPTQLPILPPPEPPPTPVKEMVLKLFTPKKIYEPPPGTIIPAAPPSGPPAKPSLFEWFRPKAGAPPGGVPIVRPELPPVPYEAPPSMFAPFAPEAPKIVVPFVEKVKEIIPREVPGLPIVAPEIFRHIKPTPEEDYEAKRARQGELWKTLFPEPEPGQKEVPLSEMFKPFTAEEEPPPPTEAQLPPVPREDLKVLSLPPRQELFPVPMDVARGIITRYQPIDELWDLIRRERQDPAFQAQVAKGLAGQGPGARFQFETLGMCDQFPTPFQAVAAFLQIPWSEVESRGQPVQKSDEYGREYTELTNPEKIFEEILFPAQEVIHQAFELVKPEDLPGNFTLEWGGHKHHSCQLILTYLEGSPLMAGAMDPALEENPFQQPPPPPEGFTTLGDVIPPEAAGPISEIMNRMLSAKITRPEAKEELRTLLERDHLPFLTEKGVLPDYIASWLAFTVGRSEEEQAGIMEEVRKITEEGREEEAEAAPVKKKKPRKKRPK